MPSWLKHGQINIATFNYFIEISRKTRIGFAGSYFSDQRYLKTNSLPCPNVTFTNGQAVLKFWYLSRDLNYLEITNKMQPCIRIYHSKVSYCSKCFERHIAHHQELKNCICSLWFTSVVAGRCQRPATIFVLFYVLFVLCRSLYCLCVHVYVYWTTATGWLPNCS